MNASLGLVPSRSLLHLGIRACRRAACTNTSSPTVRLLSIFRAPAKPRPSWSRIITSAWPSPASTAMQHARYASSAKSRVEIIREYEDLPLKYTDKAGLQFRETDLTPNETTALFGAALKPKQANKLLRILHGRRVAGTLEDPAFSINTASYTAAQQDAALEFLRKTTPVDEVLNAGLRAEDELAALEKELVESADETTVPSLKKSIETDAATPDAKPKPPTDYKADPVYGYSALDAIRAKNQAKAKAEEERLAREAAEKGEAPPGTVATVPMHRPPMSPRMQKWHEEGGSKLEAPPELTVAERVLPSAAAVLLLIGGLTAFAMIYVEPNERERMFPEISASAATVGGLIFLNALTWAAWKVPPFWRFLNRNFVLVHGMPRAVSMLTANFSHLSAWHLATNMACLWFVGTALHDEVGRANFLAVYLSSGAVGFLGSLTWFTLRGMLAVSTVGASGAVFGVATAYFWMHRFDTFKIMGFPPEPMNGPQGLGFIGLILGVQIYAMFRRGKQTVDLTSHLFGMLAGLIGVELVTKRKDVEKREDLVKDAPLGEDVEA
ncbi:Rhomboid protein 1 [Colletotrichum sidae]|uniref:Rhomboid protein 1 n=1 Tax=Colletotrichum sidae TaxID=1347389 RepID=A0A4R8T8S5_9PEZI|nr:Rhomboid protein 1 [Colletotrichum sidae]